MIFVGINMFKALHASYIQSPRYRKISQMGDVMESVCKRQHWQAHLYFEVFDECKLSQKWWIQPKDRHLLWEVIGALLVFWELYAHGPVTDWCQTSRWLRFVWEISDSLPLSTYIYEYLFVFVLILVRLSVYLTVSITFEPVGQSQSVRKES